MHRRTFLGPSLEIYEDLRDIRCLLTPDVCGNRETTVDIIISTLEALPQVAQVDAVGFLDALAVPWEGTKLVTLKGAQSIGVDRGSGTGRFVDCHQSTTGNQFLWLITWTCPCRS